MELDTSAKILIVDDQPKNRVALVGWLEAPDRLLVEANSGNEALEKILEHEFALIILDVQMPEMDGFETAELIRNRQENRHIPIIFITGIYLDDKFMFQGYDAGAVDYLPKPINPKILASKVSVFATLYQQRKQLEREVAARLVTEQILQHHQKWLETTLSSIADIVIATDSKNRIIFSSPHADSLLECDIDDMAGKDVTEFVVLMQNQQYLLNEQVIQEIMETKNSMLFDHSEVVLVGKKEKKTPVRCRISPIQENDNISGVVLAIQNLTQQKQVEAFLQEAQQTLHHLLTPREKEILQLIVDGQSTKAIAIDLGLSERTIDAHRRNIMQKLDVHDVVSLVRFSITHKLVELK